MSERAIIVNLPQMNARLANPTWIERPIGALLDKWRFSTQRAVVAGMTRGPGGWVWHGGDRRSVTSERDHAAFPRWAVVGSNSRTIRWGEYGTGLLSEDPASAHRRYFPPPAALDRWAKDHGMTGGQVAMGIYKRGGTAPRRFFRNAVTATEPRIGGWLAQAVGEIEALAAGGGA